jgi:hypothetical protein
VQQHASSQLHCSVFVALFVVSYPSCDIGLRWWFQAAFAHDQHISKLGCSFDLGNYANMTLAPSLFPHAAVPLLNMVMFGQASL